VISGMAASRRYKVPIEPRSFALPSAWMSNACAYAEKMRALISECHTGKLLGTLWSQNHSYQTPRRRTKH
jgi:hypothetical protein